ncbi:type II toxin-antitoxin system VapC family toxin [Mycobacterium branderi]|uniref:Ribonuclease VapC n=1 Tax=Mycobacterium branderi TaxID=43348 RepID=A0A7I7W5D4_9MYCO|nr:type II toxin-antitoxin system VapC family toxin [Mycobacterium branderi]MCV7234731.1 type II toxin-antitoxin system VapC family toxin [Mycobacterium branderi]ORA31409.1 VapC toxin family PIN domain ribonuclease [Mycobacterium branderi]BBZ11643.1 ribonuclease VapC48 [Mycobacterium branderi]
MSETFDVNVLVYATHRASPFHDRAKALVEQFLAGPGLVYLLWPVALSYLRIVTHPTLLDAPLTPTAAAANIEQFVSQPHVRLVGEIDGFWPAYRRVADVINPRGNLVPDAHLVALMRQHGISTIWTHDRDFRKFEGITVRDPFAG